MSFACTQTLISARFLYVVGSPYYASPTFPNRTTMFIYMRLADISLVRTQSVVLKLKITCVENTMDTNELQWRLGCCWQLILSNGSKLLQCFQTQFDLQTNSHTSKSGVKVRYDFVTETIFVILCTGKYSPLPPSHARHYYMRKSRAMPMKSMD